MCYHVSIDGCNILLDCGWNDQFDVDMLAPLAAIAPEVDAVLISHPDTAHLGALPYAFGKLGMNCKVYATLPVHKMGQMYMYDHFLTRQDQGDFQNVFSLDDVDTAFAAFYAGQVHAALHVARKGGWNICDGLRRGTHSWWSGVENRQGCRRRRVRGGL